MTATQGLAPDMPVKNTGESLWAPVGRPILLRMFDVFGNPVDRGPTLAGMEWRSVHHQPLPLVRRSTKSDVVP
jgi:F-type H+-transporting ATPase subunit beta